eukprot:764466-Hanusia_phi.AAC.6
MKRDREGAYKFASLQGAVGKTLMKRVGRDPSDLSTLVVIEPMEIATAQRGNSDMGGRTDLVVYDKSCGASEQRSAQTTRQVDKVAGSKVRKRILSTAPVYRDSYELSPVHMTDG